MPEDLTMTVRGGPGRSGTVVLLLTLMTVSTVLSAQCADGAPPPCRGARTAGANSVAVLYFDNASADSTDLYLADGITEEIISRLGELGRIQVKSRYLVRRYRGGAESPQVIGRQLSVASIVTGSVRRVGHQLRVTAEMVRTATGDVTWSERFDRADTDVLALQADLAQSMAAAITGRLLPAERQVLATQPTRNPAAYNAWLLGRFYWGKRTAADLVRAAESFQQAIRADSSFAQAWTGLADSYTLFIPAEYDVPGIDTDSILQLAEQSARRALTLAPQLGEAWTSLGEILEYRGKWVEARAAFERGLALNPLYPTAHLWYAYDLVVWNRWPEAIHEFERAAQLDPNSVVITVSLAAGYDLTGRAADAAATFARARSLAPDHPLVSAFGLSHDLFRRDYDALADDWTHFLRVIGTDSAAAADFGRRLRDPALRVAALRETAADRDAVPSWKFLVHRVLDGDDRAAQFLSEVDPDPRRSNVGAIFFCCLEPALRTDPRFVRAFSRFGFPVP
jgi:TolB-like protein